MKAINDITNFIFIEDKLEKADIIFIPGGSYSELAESAAYIWKNNYAPLILPSGKYSPSIGYFPGPSSKLDKYGYKYKTEHDFFKAVLMKNGVDESSILIEDKAENTYENAFKSREIVDKLGLNIKKAIICCKSFHTRRCFVYYQWAFPEAKIIMYPSDVQGINRENWFENEKGIDKVLNELTKSGLQFKEYIKYSSNSQIKISK